jgi:tRNA uracil 4-sulfurtransferase
LHSLIVAHYGEIGTKGGNRSVFEGFLERALSASLVSLGGASVRKMDQRFFISVESDQVESAKARLARVFGIAWYAVAWTAPLEYGDILKVAERLVGGAQGTTFRVTTRRPNKSFPMTSQELNRRVGEDIIGSLGRKVDLSNPDVTLNIDVISDRAVLYTDRVKGLGGLPVGVSGRVLHLLSGGIDSPVAAWLMMKRGCSPVYLHFYVASGPEAVVQSKIVDIAKVLSRYGGRSDIILVPFAPYQLATTGIPEDFEPTVFRRFMRMVAEALARRLEIPAISTGDNLAQVASQTLSNIVCIDSGSLLPTLRPVLGYDKDEIIALARRLETFELSIREYKDCCSIVSRHPRTRMKVADVDECARRFDFEGLAEESISGASLVTYEPLHDSTGIRPLSVLLPETREGSPHEMRPVKNL